MKSDAVLASSGSSTVDAMIVSVPRLNRLAVSPADSSPGKRVDQSRLASGQHDEWRGSLDDFEVERSQVTVVQAQLCESPVAVPSATVAREVGDINAPEQVERAADVCGSQGLRVIPHTSNSTNLPPARSQPLAFDETQTLLSLHLSSRLAECRSSARDSAQPSPVGHRVPVINDHGIP